MARKIGVAKQRISKYEINLNNPVFEVLKDLTKVFGVSVDYLIFDEKTDIKFEDKELIECFRIVDKLPYQKKKFVKDFIKTVKAMPENT